MGIDLDFIEIGTSNVETLIQDCNKNLKDCNKMENLHSAHENYKDLVINKEVIK